MRMLPLSIMAAFLCFKSFGGNGAGNIWNFGMNKLYVIQIFLITE